MKIRNVTRAQIELLLSLETEEMGRRVHYGATWIEATPETLALLLETAQQDHAEELLQRAEERALEDHTLNLVPATVRRQLAALKQLSRRLASALPSKQEIAG